MKAAKMEKAILGKALLHHALTLLSYCPDAVVSEDCAEEQARSANSDCQDAPLNKSADPAGLRPPLRKIVRPLLLRPDAAIRKDAMDDQARNVNLERQDALRKEGADQILVRKVLEEKLGEHIACPLIQQLGPWFEPEKKTAYKWDVMALGGINIASWSDFGRSLVKVLNVDPNSNLRNALITRYQFLQARTGRVSIMPESRTAHEWDVMGLKGLYISSWSDFWCSLCKVLKLSPNFMREVGPSLDALLKRSKITRDQFLLARRSASVSETGPALHFAGA